MSTPKSPHGPARNEPGRPTDPPVIQIRLYATLRRFEPQNALAYPISGEMTIQTLLRELNVPDGLVKLVFINGRKADPRSPVHPGDRVAAFPPVGGG